MSADVKPDVLDSWEREAQEDQADFKGFTGCAKAVRRQAGRNLRLIAAVRKANERLRLIEKTAREQWSVSAGAEKYAYKTYEIMARGARESVEALLSERGKGEK